METAQLKCPTLPAIISENEELKCELQSIRSILTTLRNSLIITAGEPGKTAEAAPAAAQSLPTLYDITRDNRNIVSDIRKEALLLRDVLSDNHINDPVEIINRSC